jgi:hypothetical protein
MKCQCGAAFCWLCGKQIDDTLFPAHFQWWNPTGCSNLQMNEAIEPSLLARICARLLAIIQIIILGPITLASTIASTILCFSCICLRLKQDYPKSSFLTGFLRTFSNCMSSWGMFWMIIIIFLPIGLAFGGIAASVIIIVCLITYPCYASIR